MSSFFNPGGGIQWITGFGILSITPPQEGQDIAWNNAFFNGKKLVKLFTNAIFTITNPGITFPAWSYRLSVEGQVLVEGFTLSDTANPVGAPPEFERILGNVNQPFITAPGGSVLIVRLERAFPNQPLPAWLQRIDLLIEGALQ